jgi:protein ImuB
LSARRGWQVLEACPRAAEAGVRAGMPVAEARALLAPRGSRKTSARTPRWDRDDPAADRAALRELALLCQRFTPIVGLEESDRPEALLLELAGCGHLFGSEAGLIAALTTELAQRGLTVRVGLSETIGAAWAVAHFGRESRASLPITSNGCAAPVGPERPTGGTREKGRGSRVEGREPEKTTAVLPLTLNPQPSTLNSPPSTLNPFPVAALRLSADVAAMLEKLGILACGQLFALPRSSLPARFGPGLVRRIQQALGEIPEAIVPERLVEPLLAAWETDWPVADQRAIAVVFRQLLAELTEHHLTPRRAGVLELVCTLDAETSRVEIELKLSRPCADIKHLEALFQLRCERQQWPGSIRKIAVEFRQIGSLAERQTQLFEEDSERSQRELSTFVDRVVSRLGSDAVLRPRYRPDPLPEQAWQWEPWSRERTDEKSSHRCPDRVSRARPLKLWAKPARLGVGSVTESGFPAEILRNGRRETIRRAWGPERLAAGWWRGRDEVRDYYRVETTTGAQLWIFQQRETGGWFVQGAFV